MCAAVAPWRAKLATLARRNREPDVSSDSSGGPEQCDPRGPVHSGPERATETLGPGCAENLIAGNDRGDASRGGLLGLCRVPR